MTKKVTKKKEPKEIKVGEKIEEATIVTEEIPSTPPPVVVVERADKLEPVIPKFTGNKFIGNKWYKFEKGVETKVPSHVRKLLRQSRAVEL